MRYLVISPCEDARSGVPFATGDEFLPEPDADQADRLIKAGCLRIIPDDAPDLPGNPDAVQEAFALREQLSRANAAIEALNGRVADAGTQHQSLVGEYQAARTKLDEATDTLASVTGERDQLAARAGEFEQQLKTITENLATVTGERDQLSARVGELNGLLAEATKPDTGEQPAKSGRTKN